MSTMISEVYEAFKAANVNDDKARAAAEAVAKIDARYLFADNKIDRLEATMQRELGLLRGEVMEVKGEMRSIKWLIGGVILAIGIQIIISLMHLPK
jgi:hypothetical protein